jgi:tRNA(fMet)-specific endonuclease VapC
MIILDTDHLTVLQHSESKAAEELATKLARSGEDVATTIITAEEQLRGWLAAIHGKRAVPAQLPYYQRLLQMFQFYAKWKVLPFEAKAGALFEEMRRKKLPLKTMDLKIAAIVLSCRAKLLTANLRDFGQVPNLQAENWLHD